MSESFTIQISSNLVRHLVDDGEKLKKKTKKPKPKTPNSPKRLSDDSEALKGANWPLQPPLQQTSNVELDAIQSILEESEKVVERLQKQEKNMLHEVTQRAKDLHDKEFKLPNSSRPMPCLDEKDSCLKCYKENSDEPLKCASLVKDFADCARRVIQQLN